MILDQRQCSKCGGFYHEPHSPQRFQLKPVCKRCRGPAPQESRITIKHVTVVEPRLMQAPQALEGDDE